MKTRKGFVSNSSSSSFVIRGLKISAEKVIEKLNLENFDDEYDSFESIQSELKEFCVEPDGNYFGGLDYSTLIIGENILNLEDGEVTELKNRTVEEDEKLLYKLEQYGLYGELKTYIQFVSNDNY